MAIYRNFSKYNNVYGRNGSYVTAGQQDYAERLNQIQSQREEYYKEFGIPPGVPTMKGAYGDPENTGIGYNTIITELGDHSVPKNWEQFVVKREPGETPGPPIIWSNPQDPEDAQPGYGYIEETADESEELFYYHSDHLGSTSYITDDKGNITQYTAYLPYGELLVDEHSSSEDLPYKFNGKELDEETGLYYYGARYLNPVSSIWYGVDPLMEKYPNMSPYCYTFGNPIKYLDPDGRDGEVSIKGNTVTISVNIHIYGDGASKDVAKVMQNNIVNYWGKNNKTGKGWTYTDSETKKTYNVNFKVNVDLYDENNPSKEPGVFSGKNNPFNRDNYIKVSKKATRSYVEGGDEGEWRAKGRNGLPLSQDDSSIHEFGHLLGFKDRYIEGKGVMKGWEGNIMAEPVMKGKVEQRNIDALMKPIMKEYNSNSRNTKSEFKTSINYERMQY